MLVDINIVPSRRYCLSHATDGDAGNPLDESPLFAVRAQRAGQGRRLKGCAAKEPMDDLSLVTGSL